MTTSARAQVVELLGQSRKGREAEAELMDRVHGELRRLAASYLRHEGIGHKLEPTAVVNEAYIRLLPQRGVSWENRAHFFGIAAKMMRRVLVDHARRKRAVNRDAAPVEPVSISGVTSPAREADPVDVLALHTALSTLAELDPRQAEIVEMRFFAGLTVEEIAKVLEISPATVKREWAEAKVWLRREMQVARDPQTARHDERLQPLFDALLDQMQVVEVQRGMKKAFDAPPWQLGNAAVSAARKRG